MIDNCPSGIAADALVRDVLASADCLIAGQVEQGYASLLAPGGTFASALTIALTIYVAIFGYRLILGLTSLTLGEVVPHFIKIGIVFALTTSWGSYQTLVFDTLFHGPQQVADLMVRQAAGAGTSSGDVLTALQAVFTRLIDAAGLAWGQAPPVAAAVAAPVAPVAPGAPATVTTAATALSQYGPPQFVAALLWLSAAVMLAASVGVLLVVRIILALLLLLGPIFVAFALFRATRGFAEGWLRVTVKFALVPLFALPLIAAAVAILGPIVAGFDDAPIVSVRGSPALLVVLVVLVFAAVMAQAARLGSGIAGSIRLPRGPLGTPAGMVPTASTAAVVIDRAPTASRAETIVQAIGAGNRGLPGTASAAAPAMIAATRTMVAPTAALRPMTDNSSRLGQGYRRLAIGQTAVSASRRRN